MTTISSGESDERAAFEAWAKAYGRIFLNRLASGLYAYAFTQEAWVGWKARAALATQPAESKACASVGVERDQLRAEQSANVMPQIGPLLDAWEGLNNDTKSIIREQSPGLDRCIRSINRAMEGAALASPAPSVGEPVADPLQGAADWLKSGLVDVTVADIQSRLLIGYNRARRLFDGAPAAAVPESPGATDESAP